jgi:hypothetical protein
VIEAVGVVAPLVREPKPTEKLLALYSTELRAEAAKLTLGMIEETAESIKLSPKVVKWMEATERGGPRPTEVAEKVRDGWLRWVAEREGEEVAGQFRARWEAAFATARRERFTEGVAADLKKMEEAKRREQIAEKVKAIVEEVPQALEAPAVITQPAESPIFHWAEKLPEPPKAPPGATAFERLTYPPGLLGLAADHAYHCTETPHRGFALWGAKSGLGKIMDRKLITPTGGSTHAYDLLLGASGAGKEDAQQFALLVLRSAGKGYDRLHQGGMLASAQAIEDLVRLKPNCFVVVDEFGGWLQIIQDQSSNVSQLTMVLNKLWGQKPNGRYGIIRRANRELNDDETVSIQWPTMSLAGASVSEPFWEACGDDYISGGFLNRCLIFDVGIGSVDDVMPTRDPTQLDPWFIEALQEITRRAAPDQSALPIMANDHLGPVRMEWADAKAEEAYRDQRRTVRAIPEGRRRDLSIRTPEIAVREATKLARLCGAKKVALEHFEWGWGLASHSRDMVLLGANERMKVKRDFAAVCKHIKGLLADGPMKWMDIRTKSRSAAGQFGMEIIDKAIAEMLGTHEVREIPEAEQIARQLRRPVGAPGRWFELGKAP